MRNQDKRKALSNAKAKVIRTGKAKQTQANTEVFSMLPGITEDYSYATSLSKLVVGSRKIKSHLMTPEEDKFHINLIAARVWYWSMNKEAMQQATPLVMGALDTIIGTKEFDTRFIAYAKEAPSLAIRGPS
ncbi:hypothetical protein [Shewanella violacea]|uniref:Uncharacterized protein n=2 Tax=Shewanella violacea TaxID=60217 RepID=D4ZJU9_SHEVD|nr:hypothetical protein SVI_1977 [Shewanella violacea DSS12]